MCSRKTEVSGAMVDKFSWFLSCESVNLRGNVSTAAKALVNVVSGNFELWHLFTNVSALSSDVQLASVKGKESDFAIGLRALKNLRFVFKFTFDLIPFSSQDEF